MGGLLMLKYLIFFSLLSANELNDRISNELQPTWNDGITSSYAIICIHPDSTKFAVPIEPGYEIFFTQQEKDSAIELDSTWYVSPF